MDERIEWSATAIKSFKRISKRIKKDFGLKTAYEFAHKLHSRLNQIAEQPGIGRPIGTDANKRMVKLDDIDYILYATLSTGIRVIDIIPYRRKRKRPN